MYIKVSVDRTVNAAYLQLSDNEVVGTEDLGNGVLVDYDASHTAVGIEILNLEASLPLDRLCADFNVLPSVVIRLGRLRPNISYRISRIQQSAEGTSVQNTRSLVAV